MTTVKIEVIDGHREYMPAMAHPGDAAYDIRAMVRDGAGDPTAQVIRAGETALVSAGFRMELPEGHEAQIRPRSGNARKGLQVANSPGTIDSNYRGVVGVLLYNASGSDWTVMDGDRIAQMVVQRVPEVEMQLVERVSENTDRGERGFGSSGVR